MEKNKVSFIIYIIIFCTFITGIGFFFLGKNIGLSVMYPGKTEINRDEIKENNELVEKELDNLFSYLNKSNYDDSNCQMFHSSHLENFVHSTNKYDFLHDLAPVIMTCMYKANLKEADGYKVMDSNTYNTFKKYFNVTLEKNTKEDYYNAYLNDYKINENKFKYVLDKINKSNGLYRADVMVYENNILISKGSIGVSIKDSHIYYEYFYLNEH